MTLRPTLFLLAALVTVGCAAPASEKSGNSASKITDGEEPDGEVADEEVHDETPAPSDGPAAPDAVDLSVDYSFPPCDQSKANVDPNAQFRCQTIIEARAGLSATFNSGYVAHRVGVEFWIYDSCDGGSSWTQLGTSNGQHSTWDGNYVSASATATARDCQGAGGSHRYKVVAAGGVWKAAPDGGEEAIWGGSQEIAK